MNQFEQIIRDCKIGVKAFQNVNAALSGFTKYIELTESQDTLLLSSLFHWSVVRYVKPFIDSKFENQTIRYPLKHLKKVEDFSSDLHEHLLNIRHTLIAHDDFIEISPRLLTGFLAIEKEDFRIPTNMTISNKCLLLPMDNDFVQQLLKHTNACTFGIHEKLSNDMDKLRAYMLEHNEETMEAPKYTNFYGSSRVEKEGSLLEQPNMINDSWLDAKVPEFANINAAYLYEEIKISKNFHGPETITLPNGSVVSIGDNSNELRK